MQCIGEVGSTHFVECGKKVLDALIAFGQVESVDFVPVDDGRFTSAAQAGAAATYEQFAHEPIATAVLLDADVHDRHHISAINEVHTAIE